jgi:acyl-homoserine lactone acylase PvdQ
LAKIISSTLTKNQPYVQLLNHYRTKRTRPKTVHLLNDTLLNSTITKEYNYSTTEPQNYTSSKAKLSQNWIVTKQCTVECAPLYIYSIYIY